MSLMLDVLARAEAALPALLQLSDWASLDVNYHPPRVERLWRTFEDDYRLFLHYIHPCTRGDALFHPHPWPSAMRVLEGTYWTVIGSSPDVKAPPIVLESVVSAKPETDYRYAMEHPDGWHAVVPIRTPVLSVMVTGKPWKRSIPPVSVEVRGTLPSLAPARQAVLMAYFQHYYQR